jgi:hypothetical protein
MGLHEKIAEPWFRRLSAGISSGSRIILISFAEQPIVEQYADSILNIERGVL